MAGPGLPINIDTTYPNTGDASVVLHQQHHDALHGIVNDFDTTVVGTAGFVPVGNGTVFASRLLLSTDLPGVVVNTQTANYTLALADAGKLVEMNVAAANTLTVPLNATINFPVGTQIPIRQYGAGITTITPFNGTVVIRSRGAILTTAGTYAEAMLTKRATDEWILSGDIA
jgi:hypothetical protein